MMQNCLGCDTHFLKMILLAVHVYLSKICHFNERICLKAAEAWSPIICYEALNSMLYTQANHNGLHQVFSAKHWSYPAWKIREIPKFRIFSGLLWQHRIFWCIDKKRFSWNRWWMVSPSRDLDSLLNKKNLLCLLTWPSPPPNIVTYESGYLSFLPIFRLFSSIQREKDSKLQSSKTLQPACDTLPRQPSWHWNHTICANGLSWRFPLELLRSRWDQSYLYSI